MYSTALEDVGEIDVPPTDVQNESTGCSVLQTDLNNSVFTTQPTDALTSTTQFVDASQAMINLDETQIDIPNQTTKHPATAIIMNRNEPELATDLMHFDAPSNISNECNSNIVRAQPSNSSVITLSSDGSQEPDAQDDHNQNNECDDEDMFEKSISCPPLELPDDLFDNSIAQVDDDLNTNKSLADILDADRRGNFVK